MACRAVVVGLVEIRHLKDIAEEGELSVERTGGLSSARVRAQRFLVDVANVGQIPAVIAHIGKLQREVRGKGVLQVERPVKDVGSLQVANHAHDGAGPSALGSQLMLLLLRFP